MKKTPGSQTLLGFPTLDPEQDCGTSLLPKSTATWPEGRRSRVENTWVPKPGQPHFGLAE